LAEFCNAIELVFFIRIELEAN